MLGFQLSYRGVWGGVVLKPLNQVEPVDLRRAREGRLNILQRLYQNSAPPFLMLACWRLPFDTNSLQFSYFCHFF